MNDFNICDLSDCSEYRQTLLARPPAIVHGTVLLLMVLIGAAVTWSAFVRANLVVIAPGRVRAIEQPAQIFTSATSRVEARVDEVHFDQGALVTEGQVLVRLDTQRLDNEIAKLQRQIGAFSEELEELHRLDGLLNKQLASSKARAAAEYDQGAEEIANARQKRVSVIRQAAIDLASTQDHLQRTEKLHRHHASSDAELGDAKTKTSQADETLRQARLPVDERRLAVLEKTKQVIADDFAVRLAELDLKKVNNQGQREAAEKDMANLMLVREQSVLRAPIDGIVVSDQIDVGDVLDAGAPVIEIAKQDGFRFEVAVASGDIGDLTIGMPVNIKFDAFDYQKYGTLGGKVSFMSPDSQLMQGQDPEQGKASVNPIAYVVRIELQGDEIGRDEMRGTVKLGLGGIAEIVTGQESILSIFLKKLRHTISLG